MARRIVSARDQVEMLSPWRIAAEEAAAPPNIHDLMPGRFSDGNGRWDYRHKETSGDRYLRHEYGIHPVTAPATHSYVDHRGRTQTVHYDPALTGGQVPRPGQFRHEWDDQQALYNEVSDLQPPAGMLWRGMSHDEYNEAKRRGYFESQGDHNIGDIQKGLTFFSTNPEQASNYATWFAPPDYKPTFTHPGHIVGIPDRPDIPRGPDPTRPDPTSTEVGVPGRVPFDAVTHHYVGQPSTITPGSQGVTEGWQGWEESGGSHPSSTIMWKHDHPVQHTAGARRRLAIQQPPPGLTFRHWKTNGEIADHFGKFDMPIMAPAVTAHLGDEMVGSLEWHPHYDRAPERKGEVSMISVPRKHRRKGIATAMYDWAKGNAEPALHHSPLQSYDGEAWAAAEEDRQFSGI